MFCCSVLREETADHASGAVQKDTEVLGFIVIKIRFSDVASEMYLTLQFISTDRRLYCFLSLSA